MILHVEPLLFQRSRSRGKAWCVMVDEAAWPVPAAAAAPRCPPTCTTALTRLPALQAHRIYIPLLHMPYNPLLYTNICKFRKPHPHLCFHWHMWSLNQQCFMPYVYRPDMNSSQACFLPFKLEKRLIKILYHKFWWNIAARELSAVSE